MLKELLELAKTIRDEKKYRAQLLKEKLTVDALEYFFQKSRATGVKVTLSFDNKHERIEIEPKVADKLEVKSFRQKFEEARNK